MKRQTVIKLRKIILSVINMGIRIAIIAAVFILVKRVCLTAYDYGFRVFSETPVTEGEGMDRTVEIPIGSSALEIGEILQDNGLIRDSRLFFIQEILSSYRGELNPGTYTLNTSMSAEEMMAVMAGKEEKESSEEEGG